MKEKARLEKYFKYALLIVAVAFIAVGIFRSEHGEVLAKAANICLECIGIG